MTRNKAIEIAKHFIFCTWRLSHMICFYIFIHLIFFYIPNIKKNLNSQLTNWSIKLLFYMVSYCRISRSRTGHFNPHWLERGYTRTEPLNENLYLFIFFIINTAESVILFYIRNLIRYLNLSCVCMCVYNTALLLIVFIYTYVLVDGKQVDLLTTGKKIVH